MTGMSGLMYQTHQGVCEKSRVGLHTPSSFCELPVMLKKLDRLFLGIEWKLLLFGIAFGR